MAKQVSLQRAGRVRMLVQSRTGLAALVVGIALSTAFWPMAQAQTYNVIYNFTAGLDGAIPQAGVSIDQAGNLYGTAVSGGNASGSGTVFKLALRNSSWIFSPLYAFNGGTDGAFPRARVIIGPNGSLYGTTSSGGVPSCQGSGGEGCGTVFNLRPGPSAPASVFTPWNETVLHRFSGQPDGNYPYGGDVVFDHTGNLYGTTFYGGTGAGGYSGAVYELSPGNDGWAESVIYSFQPPGPSQPYSGVIFDRNGNLFGTTVSGYPAGGVYELTPSDSGWTENTLYMFGINDPASAPYGGLIFDNAGNLYGATQHGGMYLAGWAYELTSSNGVWSANGLYTFPNYSNQNEQCYGPLSSFMMDNAGNLYGTTCGDGAYNFGSVFKLSPNGDGTWTYSSLHDFCKRGRRSLSLWWSGDGRPRQSFRHSVPRRHGMRIDLRIRCGFRDHTELK